MNLTNENELYLLSACNYLIKLNQNFHFSNEFDHRLTSYALRHIPPKMHAFPLNYYYTHVLFSANKFGFFSRK